MMQELSPDDCRARYERGLQTELTEIAQAAEASRADRKPVVLDQQSVGRLSRMDAMQGQAMAQAMQGRREARVGAIKLALQRLKGDDFGWCDECGDFIGVKRLDLDPTLQRCVGCAG